MVNWDQYLLNPHFIEHIYYWVAVVWIFVLCISVYILFRSFKRYSPVNPNKTHKIPMNFVGKSTSYFGKWFAVLLLNTITLGLYSPWGTVRLKQYLYQRTFLGKLHFDFIGNPWTILKGRAIVVVSGIFLLSSLYFLPTLCDIAVILGFLLLMPFLIIKGLQYKSRTTYFDGISFTFIGSFLETFIAYNLGYIVTLASMGLAIPLATKAKTEYFLNHTYWGDKRLNVTLSLKELYKIFFKACFTLIIILILCLLLEKAANYLFSSSDETLTIVLFTISILAARSAYSWCVYRETYNGLQIKSIGAFECQFSFLRAFWVAWSNIFLVILSLGLAYPWAKMREIRFLSKHVILWAQEKDLKTHPNNDKPSSSITDEVQEGIFDIDL